jgi:ribosomal-protein-alanine N-acetyltransferase
VSGNASSRRVDAGASAGSVETERLVLAPWGDDQLGDFARICADVRVVEFITGGEPVDEAHVREIHQRTLRLWRDHGYGPWAAFEKESGRWIGRVGLNLLPDWPGRDKWEIGYELDPAFWGRGLATEGAHAGVRYGFEVAGLERIISVTVPANRASWRVMEKCGLTRQGELEWRETKVVWYAIDRRAWRNAIWQPK